MSEKENMVDKINNDSTKIVISVKSVKWIFGILSSAILALGGLAYGLYTSVDAKVDSVKTELLEEATSNQEKVMEKLEKLEEHDVKENTTKNYKQDADIGILLDRTNSRNNINNNAVRPTTVDTVALPPSN